MYKKYFYFLLICLCLPLSAEFKKIPGALDPSFNGVGFNTLTGVASTFPIDAAFDEEGNIILAGQLLVDFGVTKFLSNGTLDLQFGGAGTGFNTIPGTTFATSLVIDSTGGIVVAGVSLGVLAIGRFTAEGLVDLSFGGNNTGFNTLPGFSLANDIIIDSEGRFLVCAGAPGGGFTVARFTSGGLIDTSFGGNNTGFRTLVLGGGATDTAFSLALDSQERIVVGGRGLLVMAVARFTPDGLVDTSFGGNNTGFNTLPDTIRINEIVLDSQEHIIATGSTATNAAVARFSANGLVDVSFGGNGTGFRTVDSTGSGTAIRLDARGRIVMSGGTGTDVFIARLKPDGASDFTFGPDQQSIVTFTGARADGPRTGLLIDTIGRIVIAANQIVTLDMLVARFFGEEYTLCTESLRKKYCVVD